MAKLQKLGLRVEVQKPKVSTADANSWREGQKEGSAARGYGSRWQSARKQYLLANPLCVRCKREGIVRAANVVDHITPHQGDQTLFWDRENNWQSLCTEHHNKDKQREEAKFKFSYR